MYEQLLSAFRELSAELVELACRDYKSVINVGSELSEAENRVAQL